MRTPAPRSRPSSRPSLNRSGSLPISAPRTNPDATTAEGADAFEGRDKDGPSPGLIERLKNMQIRTQRTGFSASTFLFGAEFMVRVNHVDPLVGPGPVRVNWVSQGAEESMALEQAARRIPLSDRLRMEVAGPALSARVVEEGLPLSLRFAGVGFATDFGGPMPDDETPPKVELKVEVRVTDKSIASLASLAGLANELGVLTTAIAGTKVADLIGNALVAAIPIASGFGAMASTRAALQTFDNPASTKTDKSLAVARAVADTVSIFFPLGGTLASMGVVAAAAGFGAYHARRGLPATTPPSASASVSTPTTTTPTTTAATATDPGSETDAPKKNDP